MRFTSFLAVTALVGLASIWANVPAAAEPGVLMPRGPVLSYNDPIFRGLLLSPGFSKCKALRGRFQWKCTYGDVPADADDRFGKKPKPPGAPKSATK